MFAGAPRALRVACVRMNSAVNSASGRVLKIAFHIGAASAHGGGIRAYVRHMAGALLSSGHRVLLLGDVAGIDAQDFAGTGVDLCDPGPAHNGKAVAEAARRARDTAVTWGADWIEAPDHGGGACALARLSGRPPLVVKMHACLAHRIASRAHAVYRWQRVVVAVALWRARHQIRRERELLSRADALISPSAALLRATEEQRLRLPGLRAVIPNPFGGSIHAALPGVPAARAPTILFVGRLDLGKGIASLPGMLAAVSAKVPGARLEIAGEDGYARFLGRLRPWLEERFRRGGMADRVRFLGQLDGGGLAEAYARAWVLVLPSRWDTFPTVLLEAMAVGLPLVSSPFGGMPEMLEGTGCPLADPESPEFAGEVVALLLDARRRRDLAQRLRDRVRTGYAPEVVVRAYTKTLCDWFGTRS